MNKLLHAIVYLILIVAVAALVFEKSLFDKRSLLGDRNRAMEDYIVRLARTIEKADAPRPMTVPEAKKDISPIEARQVDTPEMENVLEEYPAQLETQNLETFNWDTSAVRLQLRQLYMLGPDGQPVPDAANYNKPMTKGKGTMAELMDQLFERAKAQQSTLNSTRAALAEIRGKLESAISEYNKLKPDARLLKMTEEELKQKITQLGQEKETLEEQVTKLKSRVEEQTGEITSLKDEV
jgi:DNA repair exonuclease SbcCD ATPase subunit